jgi:F0F1-type ATP synthase assembly protein I
VNEKPAASTVAEDERLERLAREIEAERQEVAKEDPPPNDAPISEGPERDTGRIGHEFVGSILAGGVVGWLLGEEFSAAVSGTVIGVIAGFAVGAAHVWRVMNDVDRAVGFAPKKDQKKQDKV